MDLKPPALTGQQIALQCKTIWDAYGEQVTHRDLMCGAWSFDRVFKKVIAPLYGIELVENEDLGRAINGHKVLGTFDIASNRVTLDRSLAPGGRFHLKRPWVAWHEVFGHGVLQGPWLRRQWAQAKIEETSATIRDFDRDAFEAQANSGAAAIAMPRRLIQYAINEHTNNRRDIAEFVGPKDYWFGKSRCSCDDIWSYARFIAACLGPCFGGVSKTALARRLLNLRLVRAAEVAGSKTRTARVAKGGFFNSALNEMLPPDLKC